MNNTPSPVPKEPGRAKKIIPQQGGSNTTRIQSAPEGPTFQTRGQDGNTNPNPTTNSNPKTPLTTSNHQNSREHLSSTS